MTTIKHGHTRGAKGKTVWSATYMSWASMCNRVNNELKPTYARKGIQVCERWKDFRNFLEDMGDRPLGPTKFSLDRIDNDKGYEPGNCRWATQTEQTNNQSSNKRIAVAGESMTVMEASRKYGISGKNIYMRLKLGWDETLAATTPPLKTWSRRKKK